MEMYFSGNLAVPFKDDDDTIILPGGIYYSGNLNMPFKDDDDTVILTAKKLQNTLSKGDMTGKLLIDISGGPLISHLYTAPEFFKEIIMMRTNEKSIVEMKKWQSDHTGAFSWGLPAAHVTSLEGKSDQYKAKEMKLKSAITHVMKFDTKTKSLTDLIGGQQADCLISFGVLDMISKDQDDYKNNLRKFLKLLKPGGHLIILGVTNGSHFTFGAQRLNSFSYDKNFASNALLAEGLTILQSDLIPRKSESHLNDYDGFLYITARKPK